MTNRGTGGAKPTSARVALDRLADALIEDIMSMTDEEIIAEAIEDGIDPEENAKRMREIFERAVEQVRKMEALSPCPACGQPAEQHGPRLVMCSDYACSFSCSIEAWQKIGSAFAERDKYKAALEAIADFCESPDWEHGYEESDYGSGYVTCDGRGHVRELIEEAFALA